MQIRQHIALAPYTTFRVGGEARYVVIAKHIDDIQEALRFARTQQLPTVILGGGSNVLVADEGFDGLVLKIEIEGVSVVSENETYAITAGAGESWDSVVLRAVEDNVWGIENLSGIPGTVGGAVVQNIGAYGAALSQVLTSVEVFDTTNEKIQTLSAEECGFGYRGSIFKNEEGRYVVLSATLALSRAEHRNLSYKDLANRFAEQMPTLKELREAVLEIRKAKFPDISVEGTAGSFFKNPIMSREDAYVLKEKYPGMPLFDMPETDSIKVPLAWLLDNALHLKGYAVDGARVFEKQPLVIAAARGTSSKKILELASFIQKKVFDELKIKIEPEVKIF